MNILQRNMLLLSALLIMASAQLVNAQQPKNFTIQGQINGLPEGTPLYLVHVKRGAPDTLARVLVKNGNFKFTGSVFQEPEWYFIKRDQQEDYIRIFLQNAVVKLNGDAGSWPKVSISGAPAHADYLEFAPMSSELLKAREQVETEIREMYATAADSITISLANRKLDDLRLQLKEVWKKFISSHPASLYSPFLLSQPGMNYEEKKACYALLTAAAKASSFGVVVKKELDFMEKSARIKPGEVCPDFSANDPDGKPLSLWQVTAKSKLTLIDFWASWCGPCREETPNIRKVYQAFHDQGFNVLSVSFDFGATAWKAAIAKDNMLWYHMSELKGREADVHKMFKLNAIPSCVLLDEKGRIIAIDAPASGLESTESLRGENLYKKVAALLGTHGK